MTIRAPIRHPGLLALLTTQALTAFNHGMLRSALLTLAAFRGFTAFGLSSEAIVALSTILIVAPYVVFSIPAGRLADRYAKGVVIRTMMAFEIAILGLMAIALTVSSTPLLLLAVLLAGTQSALMGPAKFGIMPEIVPSDALILGNGWLSAAGTAATLAGLVLGNILILDNVGFWAVVAGGIGLSLAGWLASLRIGGGGAKDVSLSLGLPALASDYWVYFRGIARVPGIVAPLIGSSWFWFQGAAVTTLIPLYVAHSTRDPQVVSILLLAPTAGVVIGAISASLLLRRFRPATLCLALVPTIVLPGLDLWFMPALTGPYDIARATADLLVMAAGSGFYLVPLTAAIQRLTPPSERARFIGVSHTLSGFAMILAGLAVLLLTSTELRVVDIFLATTILTALLAATCLLATLSRPAVATAALR